MSKVNADSIIESLKTSDSSQSVSESESKQIIHLKGNDETNNHTIYARDIEIIPSKSSGLSNVNASNKIKVNKIVNYDWEPRYSYGNLIAIHKSGLYFAYSIRVENNGKVRVFHKKLNEKTLLKSFRGRVVDLSFAHCDSDVLLGCVDETGSLQIFKITLDASSKIQTTLVFNLAPLIGSPKLSGSNSQLSTSSTSTLAVNAANSTLSINSDDTDQSKKSAKLTGTENIHRIIWCTYIPDPSANENEAVSLADDASKVFLLTNRNRAEIFHLDLVQLNSDCKSQLNASSITIGHLSLEEHKSIITTAGFSPDGSAIATASANGEVNFYKISFSNTNYESTSDNDGNSLDQTPTPPPPPRNLQKWVPHGNKPVSSLYFLDDHKNPSPDAQFWSFILTGCDYNREIKIWSCMKWECLQTISFMPGEENKTLPCLKTAIDLSSNYLIMSDIARRCFYVMHLFQDAEKSSAKCTAVSEFNLAYPALSFALIETKKIRAKLFNTKLANINAGTGSSLDDMDANSLEHQTSLLDSLPQDDTDDNDLITQIKLYCIQTKQLQEMTIFLNGEQNINVFNNSYSPPPMMHSFNNSASATSILQQLLPNANITSSNSPSSKIKPLKSLNNSLSKNLLSNSMSFTSDLKDGSDFEQENNMSSLNNNKSIGSSSASKLLPPGMLKLPQSANDSSIQDSSIVEIANPQLNSLGVNVNPTPLLMTPDAFINSPNNQNNRRSIDQQPPNKVDLLQSLMSSTNSNTNNLLSSRTSSLTHVTSAISAAAPPTVTSNSASAVGAASAGGVTTSKLSTNSSKIKKEAQNNRSRNLSSSSSSSSDSSTDTSSRSSSSSSSECSSIMDSADKEIAALSANNNRSGTTQNGSGSNSVNNNKSKSNSKRSSLLDNKVVETTSMLLNQVKIDNDDNQLLDKNDENLSETEFKLTSKPFSIKNWPPNPPDLNDPNDATPSLLTTTAPIYITQNSDDGTSNNKPSAVDLKSLLVQMTHAIQMQHEEIENLKKHQINSQSQLKSQIDLTLKQFLSNQQQFNQLNLNHKHSSSGSASATANSMLNDESQLSLIIQQSIASNLVPRMDKIIKEEINKSIQNQLAARLIDPLREQISREIADKLKATENILKDSVAKMFKSKSTLDSISQSIISSMQGTIVNSFRDTFQKIVAPSFEKACQNMYQQVNATFAKGTQDYMHEFEQSARLQRKIIEENKEPVLNQMKQYNEQLHLQGAQMAANLTNNIQEQFDALLRNTNAVLQDTIISSVKAIIKEELQVAMRDQQHSLPDRLIAHMRQSGTMTPINFLGPPFGSNSFVMSGSQSATPNPMQDPQSTINQYLQKGNYNSAFQTALCASDLSLLMHLCELVTPNIVFEQTLNPKTQKQQCQLQQPVLLSLIQQLSQELQMHTDLKVKYLEEALVNLDQTNPLTREHTPAVIGQLVQKLQQYVQLHPNEKITKSIRMLMMASQSLLSTPKTANKQ